MRLAIVRVLAAAFLLAGAIPRAWIWITVTHSNPTSAASIQINVLSSILFGVGLILQAVPLMSAEGDPGRRRSLWIAGLVMVIVGTLLILTGAWTAGEHVRG